MLLDNSELINYSSSKNNTRQPFPIPFVPIPFGPVFVPPIFGFPPVVGYPSPRPHPNREISPKLSTENYTICYIPIVLNKNNIEK